MVVAPEDVDAFLALAESKTPGGYCGQRHGRASSGDELERQDHRGREPGIPELQWCGEAH